MSESILLAIVAGLTGVFGTVVGTVVAGLIGMGEIFVSHSIRQKERKSDRRREAREGDLKIVRDSVDAVVEAQLSMRGLPWQQQDSKSRLELLLRVAKEVDKALLVAGSLDDQELLDRYSELKDYCEKWVGLLDVDTGMAKKRKGKQFEELKTQVRVAAALVWSRTREIREEI